MPSTLRNLEIFATGIHRAMSGQITVTDEDLDKIVDAFDSLQGSNIVRPHLKLGHDDAQKWFGQKDGIPALGWITKVWRQGRKLLANVDNIPDSLIELIQQGRFHNVSAEIFWDQPISSDGRTFSRVLSAVSLLGVEMPAVKDLAGLADALFQTEPVHQFKDGSALSLETTVKGDDPMPPDPKGDNVVLFNTEQHEQLVDAAVKAAVEEAKAEFTDELASAIKELEVATTRADGAEAELAKVILAATNTEAEHIVDEAIKEGKILPKQKDFALAALTSNDSKIKFGDGEKSMAELFKDFLDASGKVIDPDEKGTGDNKVVNFATAAQEVDHKVKEAMEANDKLDYEKALDKVLASDEDLKTRYFEMQA